MTESEDANQREPQSEPEEPGLIERTMRALELTKGVEIARRYLAMNAFDGALTMLGLILGGLVSMSVLGPETVYYTTLLAALGTSMAMAISGFSGSYLTESAERDREVEEMGKAMLTDMSNSMYAKATRITSVVVALVDGLAPSIAALIVVSPLFFVGVMGYYVAFYAAIVVCMILLFGLGLFLGSVSGKSIWGYGAKTLLAGILTAMFMFLISILTGAEI
ncbi:MAG: VIT1/CCC1 transporter family protein [Candidatus Thorarchaeota archaeon]